jgi:hypothetical protein
MKSLCTVLAISLLAGVPAARGADNLPTTKPSSPDGVAPPSVLVFKNLEEENKALRSQVEAQREQIKKLSNELREREQELAQLMLKQRLATLQPQVPQVQPFSLAPSNPLPPGSVPQRFNGSTFYLVPLAESPMGAGTLKMKTVDVQEAIPATIEVRPIGTIDDRTGTTRNLIHGK